MITQRRRTAGIRLVYSDTQVHVDPGPGALVYSNVCDLSPQKLSGLIVTHGHPDHYSDAEVFIEAMTGGGRNKRGVLAAPRSVLSGNSEVGPSISKYHRGLTEELELLKPGKSFNIVDLEFQAVKARHSDPDTVGIVMDVPGLGKIGYTSDTGYLPDIVEEYEGLRLLILCCMWPRGRDIKMHLNSDDTIKILKEAKPGCALLTHFGMRMLNADPDKEAKYIEEETGIPTVSAVDGLKLVMEKEIRFFEPNKNRLRRKVEY